MDGLRSSHLDSKYNFREESIVHFFSVAGDVIITWSRDFKKSSYLQ